MNLYSPELLNAANHPDGLPESIVNARMSRYNAVRSSGLSHNQALYGQVAGSAADKVESRISARLAGESWGLKSYALSKVLRSGITTAELRSAGVDSRTNHALDVLFLRSDDASLKLDVHAAGIRHAPALPYISKHLHDVVALNGLNEGRKTLERMSAELTLSGAIGDFSLSSPEIELSAFADKLGAYFVSLFSSLSIRQSESGSVSFRGLHFLEPDTGLHDPSREREICHLFDVIQSYLCWSYDDFLDLIAKKGSEPMERRLCDATWLRRRLRVVKALKTADFYRAYGFVHKKAEPIIADQVLSDRKFARERNDQTLQNTVVFNEADPDEWLSLYSVSRASVSNPELRRVEMMTRIKGFEAVAKKEGYQGLFLTFTTPSRFHAYHHNGIVNQNWLDAGRPTVNDAQTWLNERWAEIRTALKDADIRIFGFRFVEPHHDGTPHWHAVLFVRPEQAEQFNAICFAYMLPDDDYETQKMISDYQAGKEIARFKSVLIDPVKGSAIAYAAAYVSKNLDGAGSKRLHDELGDKHDVDAKPVSDTVSRVDAWRSAYNIRQFAQIGGPSVSVWRELRRVREPFQKGDPMFADLTLAQWGLLETIRLAASDKADFETFIQAMGGVTVKRADQSIRIQYGAPETLQKAYEGAVNELFDGIPRMTTKYGDLAKESITGFLFMKVCEQIHPKYICTRQKQWSVADKKRFLATVRDQFDLLEKHELYMRMAEEQYQKYLDDLDAAESKLEQQLILIERLESDFDYVDYLDAVPLDNFATPQGGEIGPLDQCH